MSRFRMLFVSGVLVFIVAGHLVDAWMGRDHWPFAAYPMFAGINKPDPFTSEELRGVTPDGREIAITSDMIGVMHLNRVRPSLVRIYNHSRRTGSPEPLGAEKALDALLNTYEARRQRGEHQGPPLSGLRFYRLKWEFMWRAENAATPERAVLFETTSGAELSTPGTSGPAPASAPVADEKVLS